MERKAVSGIMLTLLLLTSMLTLAFNIQQVKASGTIVVPDDYPTIQDAINAANSRDTIYVRAGTYYECLTIDKTLNLVGEDKSTTVIDGNRTAELHAHVVTITANYVTLSSLTIQRSQGPWAAIYLTANHSVMTNNNIKDNYEGIYLRGSNNNSIFGNKITNNYHGGIYLYESFYNTVSGNNITNNGVGIYLIKSSRYNIIFGNNITNNWSGIWFWGTSNNTVFHNNFVNNTYRHAGNPGMSPQDRSFDQWDDGYPSGGNYWSNYTDVDLYSGPYQNETGSDGIWDHPYVIDANNTDRYPLVNPWTLTSQVVYTSISHPATKSIYEIKLEVNGTLTQGARLTIKFYSYSNALQTESTVWNGTTPTHIELYTQVQHPLGMPVENATLVLCDDLGNILQTLTSFIMRRSHLVYRLGELDILWALGYPKPPMFIEIVEIESMWPYAPP